MFNGVECDGKFEMLLLNLLNWGTLTISKYQKRPKILGV